MIIKEITIKNFRGIEKLENFQLNNLSIFIGNNGTSKTSILEAINFALSPSFLSGRIKYTDFYKGGNNPIEIQIIFEKNFYVSLPDGFVKQDIECKGIYLEVNKRAKSTPNKAFSDIVTIKHFVLPILERGGNGWSIKRKNGSIFKFDERLLSFPVETDNLPKSFYFGKNREKQLYKGFNSFLSTLIDDFNWRFHKNIRKDVNGWENFYTDTYNYEEKILSNIDETTHNKTIQELNKKLKNFDLPEVDFSIINKLEPFENSFLTQKTDDIQLPVSYLGSGIEILISILFLETIASLSKSSLIIIIDEPELHLHPKFQKILIDFFQKISNNHQIILSTHSPFLFHGLKNKNTELLLSNKKEGNIEITNTGNNFGIFPWSPSWGEINYFAYNLYTIDFFNELYGFLEEIDKTWKDNLPKNKDYIYKIKVEEQEKNKGRKLTQGELNGLKRKVCLYKFVRDIIHHPENGYNNYTKEEFEQCIDDMIQIISKLKI